MGARLLQDDFWKLFESHWTLGEGRDDDKESDRGKNTLDVEIDLALVSQPKMLVLERCCWPDDIGYRGLKCHRLKLVRYAQLSGYRLVLVVICRASWTSKVR